MKSLLGRDISRRSRVSALAAMTAMALGACAPPEGPIAPPPASSSPPKPSSTSHDPPRLSLLGDTEPEGTPPAPPPPPPPPAPLTRTFEPVALPEGTPEILAADGLSERDVWMLATDGSYVDVLRWDGAKVVRDKPPKCPFGLTYHGLFAGPSGPVAIGAYEDFGGPQRVEARRSEKGAWSCDKRGSALFLAIERPADAEPRPTSNGSSLVRFEAYRAFTIDGLPSPQPAVEYSGNALSAARLKGRSPVDLWLFSPYQKSVHHWDGVRWESLKAPFFVRDLDVGADNAVWLLGGRDERGEGDIVFQWNRSSRAFVTVPTPRDLRASRILAARDVWILGKEQLHRWDGAALQRGPTPLDEMRDAWLGRGGELWIVGGDKKQPAKGRTTRGLAFRSRPPQTP